MLLKVLWASLISGLFSFALAGGVSAVRYPQESFQHALTRHALESGVTIQVRPYGQSALDHAAGLDKMDFSQAPDVGSIERLNQIFLFVRDSKFVQGLPGPLSERRLSWLYPDDGCYIRAELALDFTEQAGLPVPLKFFSFGDLAVKTFNHPEGVVRWWYHVVPLYRVGNQAYVLDPAIDPTGPMTVENWKKSQEADSSVDRFSVCSSHTVGPYDHCTQPRVESLPMALEEQKDLLQPEWDRLIDLDRNPESELGNTPPWKN